MIGLRMSRNVKFAALVLIVLSVAIAGLVFLPLCPCEEDPRPTTPVVEDAYGDDDTGLRSRLGVALVGSAVPLRNSGLPIGWYKDYTFEGAALAGDEATIRYTPVLLYQSKRDNFMFRRLLRFFWHLGYVPHAPDSTVCSMLDAFSLERLEMRIRQAPDRYPPGTLFFAGSEPGYRWADDDRTPREIVDDSRRLRALLDRLDRGYRLALGGISTPRNELTRSAYGGMHGIGFLESILDLAGDLEFDAFVIHPYPSDPAGEWVEDTKRQITEFRRVLFERGLQEKELIVGEVGTPFTGAPEAEVALFLEEVLRFTLTHRDREIGNPNDDYRLVQRTFWFLLAPPSIEIAGFTDNPAMEFDVTSLLTSQGGVTPLARRLEEVVSELEQEPSAGRR